MLHFRFSPRSPGHGVGEVESHLGKDEQERNQEEHGEDERNNALVNAVNRNVLGQTGHDKNIDTHRGG